MKTFTATCLLIAGLAFAAGVSGAEIMNFKVLSSSGEVTVQPAGQADFVPVVEGAVYEFGSTLNTERNATAILELSPGNTFRLMSGTRLLVTMTTTHRKLVRLGLAQGGVNVTLNEFPKDTALDVETPLGVCAVVGTEFTIYYEVLPNNEGKVELDVLRGEVTFDSSLTSAMAIAAGGNLAVAARMEAECGYRVMVTVTGEPIKLNFGDRHEITVQPGTTLEVIIPNVPGDKPFVAVNLIQGQATVGEQGLSAGDPPFFVDGNTIMDTGNAGDYMQSMRDCFDLAERLRDENLTPEQLAELLASMQEAAGKVQEAAPVLPPPDAGDGTVPPVVDDVPQSPGGNP